jgi:hypothetical protein
VRLGLRRGHRVCRPALSAARLWRHLGRTAAVGPPDPRPRAGSADKPLLRRGLRARPLHLPAPGRARRHRAHQPHPAAPRRVARADPRSPRGLPELGRLFGQRDQAGRQPHQRRSPATPGRISAVSRDHHLWILRQGDAHQLPHRPKALLRMRPPRRWTHHPDLPIHRRVGRGHRRRRQTVGGAQSRRGRPCPGRR